MHLQSLPDTSDQPTVYGGHGTLTVRESAKTIERFSHLVLGVTDLVRSEAFYRDVLGLDLLGRDLVGERAPHSVVQMNTGQLIILVLTDQVWSPGRSGVHHGFMVTPNQYRLLYERLHELGYPVEDDREMYRAHGQYSIDVVDPDGHRFQIQCYGPEGKQIMPGAGVVDCGAISQFKVGDVRPFKSGNFHLVRLHEGFLAVSKWCTHFNGIVIYQKAHWHFHCPFHGATYDRRGVPAPYPGNSACGPLRLHPITFTDDGRILVDTDETITREGYDPSQVSNPTREAVGARP
ncbi:MAG: Rieske 2Fe-2S domain-containing protein [Chloroflexi bacterium]|nr:Rieske 2Fe-2S domain-containing protein [Chloroflexota bacterium]